MDNSPISLKARQQVERAVRMDEAASEAIQLVKSFAERDPYDGELDNPWRNPQQMFDQMRQAAENVKSFRRPERSSEESPTNDEEDADEFRTQIIEMMTDAFAEELDVLRANEEEELDVEILVDCLQSGIEVFTREEKEIFMAERSGRSEIKKSMMPHEQRRRQLGFHIEP